MNKHYDDSFHKSSVSIAKSSALEIVPWLLQNYDIKSVVDFGCGVGAWLSVFKSKGIKRVLGYDGGYVDKKSLIINPSEYIESNLATSRWWFEQPQYDLAISLETAEHLPSESADNFVKILTSSADLILFSAAVPNQGGILHYNEQWPDYWQEKFAKHGFMMVDIRGQFLANKKIAWWYRQNMFLLVKSDKLKKELKHLEYNSDFKLVHNSIFNRYKNPYLMFRSKLYKFIQHRGFVK